MTEQETAQAPVKRLKELQEVLARVSREIDGRGQQRPRLTVVSHFILQNTGMFWSDYSTG